MRLTFLRRRGAPAGPQEPTPYCDRLTLAEPFHADPDTRPSGEDLRTYHTLADSFVETLSDVVRRPEA